MSVTRAFSHCSCRRRVAEVPDFGHWSASRFMAWELCPREFKRVYVDGEYSEPSEAMLFGSAVHNGLEAHYNGADGVSAFRQAWKGFRDEHALEALPGLTATGMDLVELVVERGWSGLSEYVFTLDTALSWGYPTVGAIDLIDCSKASEARGGVGGIVVRDFKTTTGAWGWDRAKRDPWQPLLYCWAAWEKFGIWPDFEYVVLHKVSKSLDVFHFDGEEISDLMDTVNERALVIAERHAAQDYTCTGKHGDCLECGARFEHDHVCDLNVRAPRIGSATKEARARGR